MGIDVKRRWEGFQSYLMQAYNTSCYYNTLCSIAEESTGKPVDWLSFYTFQDEGWLGKDFTVYDACAILNHFTGYSWTRKKVTKLPASIADNEFTAVCYYNPKTGYTHYRRRSYDGLDNSRTVREGYIAFYYIFTCNQA